MAHQEFTGASGPTSITYDGANIPTGWRKITISEKGKPLSTPIDKTHAGDASYQWMADPLGGKGSASATVDVEGFLSVTDHQDSGLLSKTFDGTGNVIVTTGTSSDKFTLTAARYAGMDVGGAFADVQPFKASFSLASSSGAWSTAA